MAAVSMHRLLFLHSFLSLAVLRAAGDLTDGNSEHLKREHSLIKPYQGVGSSSMPLWDFMGSTMLTSQYVRLTPDERSKEGSIWNRIPCFLKDWELHVHFRVHGAGKKNLHGDGFGIWYAKDRLERGPVFGNQDKFHGLAVFVDTYPNDETTERVFPYISAMVNNGSLEYDHGKDGRSAELAGCTADLRNANHDTFLAIRYSRGRLTCTQASEETPLHYGLFWMTHQEPPTHQKPPTPLSPYRTHLRALNPDLLPGTLPSWSLHVLPVLVFFSPQTPKTC